MDFKHLEVFVAIAEYKSFSKAAEHLYLSQSTISIHLKNLEKYLGKKLINRSTKQVQLTPDGEIFLSYAKRLIETRDSALTALNLPVNSFIQIGASTIPSGYLLPQLLSDFRSHYSDVFFDIKQSDSNDIINKVIEDTVEIGIVGAYNNNKDCIFIPFCNDNLVIATPATSYYLSLKKDNNCISHLLQSPMIMREQGSGTKKAADIYLQKENITYDKLNIVAKINDLESIKQMILNGIGISIISNFAVKTLAEQGQILTFPLNSNIKRQFFIVHKKSKLLKPIVKYFIDYTVKYYKEYN